MSDDSGTDGASDADAAESGAERADGDASVDERVESMYRDLAATAERPVNRESSAYLGEAEAVARDLHERAASREVVRERAGHVVRLLDSIEGTGDDAADGRVASARATAAELAGAEATSREDDS
ncbi:hypothetical protein [Candidatus Halobonum tyrrellensis]|uniref:DUF8152 domain-containing protein n=1 Tax=Candidatus Halobonum tyrrellensis G22 TaxID=1324957 RepID=V4J3E2_9EURY|nr:hypothetical protein [Candidatus Halobonum tyrrellensis]ESP89902.1 hypothetical protein K933_01732 [Candidatus Halobonum tyrrellensis G22]